MSQVTQVVLVTLIAQVTQIMLVVLMDTLIGRIANAEQTLRFTYV